MNYLIIGNDRYIKDTEEKKLKKKFLSQDEMDLNYSVCGPDNIEEIMSSLETIPFLSDKRVVHVKDLHLMADEHVDILSGYLEKHNYINVLILTAEPNFKKTKSYKKISKFVELIKADAPDANTLRSWIRSFFKKSDIQIDDNAIDLLVELKGTDTSLIRMELEKLLQFSSGDTIRADHVSELVGRSVRETIFALVDSINDRNIEGVFKILNDLYAQKKQSAEILGYLGWYIRIIQRIKFLLLEGQGESQIASDLGYSVYYVRRLIPQAKKYSYDTVRKWITGLYESDLAIKRGKNSPNLALETLVVNFMNNKKRNISI